MFAGTHICLPLIIAGLSDLNRFRRNQPPRFSKNALYLIGFAGIFPDLLSIHISLEARHHSPAHTLWFPLVLLPVLSLFAIPRFRRYFPVALLSWLGIVLHLFCDLISGGIPLWGVNNGIVGRYFIPPAYWVWLDVAMILTVWYLFFRLRFLESEGTMTSPTCSWEEKILDNWRAKATRLAPEQEKKAPLQKD